MKSDEHFLPEDYRFTAALLRQHLQQERADLFQATCSNNLNFILEALDKAGASKADLFWDDAEPEFSETDIADILDNYGPGEIVHVRRAVCLHDVFAVRVGDKILEFDSLEDAEARSATP